ncbi:acetyl-CoA acetyltransferase [Saccharopolyspora griseoalba]|uniref:Acetyl-CoA acetyltransferase n=1 Tax=Saccharopolyspora griseoalba TaxID=1431848 RepID=A0ABW2LM95_9PSEU
MHDERTPVLVGVGEFSERIDDPEYRALPAVELAAEAARRALADTGVRGPAGAIDVVAGTRQFENSDPFTPAPFGRSDNFPRSVAARVGAEPRRAVLSVAGGQSPQALVNEMAGAIAAGRHRAVLLCGADAASTHDHLRKTGQPADFAERVGGQLEDRGHGLEGIVTGMIALHGLVEPASQYALAENARRARLGLSRADHARAMAELLAPFSEIAAANPHAASRVIRGVDELAERSGENRPIAEPYLRYACAREKVNQGAALLLTSVGEARRLGIAEDQQVFLAGHADLRERELLDRPDLSTAPASVRAVRHALELAGIETDELSTLDLYSCFPIAVFTICDALDLAIDDPRGLTVTGGLPFFGGAGNNYSMHAIAETARRLRARPGSFGLVGANGGIQSKYSAGVYASAPVRWRESRSAELQAAVDSEPAVEHVQRADGWARIETYTVRYRHGQGVVIGRLERDGRRFIATADPELLAGEQPIGRLVHVRSTDEGNLVTRERPAARPAEFRDAYEHLEVRRDGALLEVVINRPEHRNGLHPPAHAELDEVFDAYFADGELRVAILTGVEDVFCTGDDLAHRAGGMPWWMPPRNGHAGLTARERLPKPVIAAVNGAALDGGLEIALACHLVVADPAAEFALAQARSGRLSDAGGLVRLPRQIPPKLAHDMILTGAPMTAERACASGLVSRVSEPGKVLEAARTAAAEILAAPPRAIELSLRVLADTEDDPAATGGPHPAHDHLALCPDHLAALRAHTGGEPRNDT